MRNDINSMRDALGFSTHVFAYPYGYCSTLSDIVLLSEGYDITLTTVNKINTVVKGLPQSLVQMGRIQVTEDKVGESLLALLTDDVVP